MIRFFRCLVLLALFLAVSGEGATAQPLAAYTNLQNQVMVWDNGVIRKIDYLPPVLLKVGRSAIPYLDNARNFKIYYAGGTRTINPGYTNNFFATDNLVAYFNSKSLNVFDGGTIKNLSYLCTEYFIGDSVILFQDGVQQEYKVYYNGAVYPIENFLAGPGLEGVKVSDNIAAYDNYANQFRIFYQGNILDQEDYAVTSFSAGRNTVAYVDANRMFKIFHSGFTNTYENFPPPDYQTGDNVVAWTSQDGYFKIYYADSVYTIGYFNAEYQVGDNVVAYRDNSGYLRVFYKGQVYNVDNYYPENLNVQYNSLAYINKGGTLRMFSDGELYDVTTAQVESWELSYDVLKYRVGLNLYRVFYKGVEY